MSKPTPHWTVLVSYDANVPVRVAAHLWTLDAALAYAEQWSKFRFRSEVRATSTWELAFECPPVPLLQK